MKDSKTNLDKLAQNLSDIVKDDKPKNEVPKVTDKSVGKVNKKQKQKVLWVGTSISKQLDKRKLEDDLDVELKVERAYCIADEEDALFRNKNFKLEVPKALEKDDFDTLVLQTGSIEITNIDVNQAVMDTKKNIEDYK